MRRSAWQSLVISSLLALAGASPAAVRPHYGGTVRVSVRESPAALDPATLAATPDDRIAALLYEGLTQFDEHSHLQPQLATHWQADSDYRRWQFWLRNGVKFHDGSPLTPESVAASLHAANPTWHITTADDTSLIIETDTADATLPAELALPRNAIARQAGNKLSGTGPFQVASWQAARKLELAAFDDYWGGRPFADALDISLDQNWRQQAISLELGRADAVEVAPQQVRRATLDGKQVFESAPNELIALVFAHDPQSEQELRLRQALSAAIDRSSIRNVLLQGQGEAANSILPDWMTGYAFLFAQREPAKLTAAASPAVTMTLAYDAADPASQLIAQRVALNGRDAGVNLQPVPSPASADALLLSIPLPSANARVALAAVANSAGIALSPFQGTSPQELYARELQMLQSGRIIPLVHVPQAAAVSPNLQGWREDQFGEWHLEDVWLGAAKP